jgi:hypothetical protein
MADEREASPKYYITWLNDNLSDAAKAIVVTAVPEDASLNEWVGKTIGACLTSSGKVKMMAAVAKAYKIPSALSYVRRAHAALQALQPEVTTGLEGKLDHRIAAPAPTPSKAGPSTQAHDDSDPDEDSARKKATGQDPDSTAIADHLRDAMTVHNFPDGEAAPKKKDDPPPHHSTHSKPRTPSQGQTLTSTSRSSAVSESRVRKMIDSALTKVAEEVRISNKAVVDKMEALMEGLRTRVPSEPSLEYVGTRKRPRVGDDNEQDQPIRAPAPAPEHAPPPASDSRPAPAPAVQTPVTRTVTKPPTDESPASKDYTGTVRRGFSFQFNSSSSSSLIWIECGWDSGGSRTGCPGVPTGLGEDH